MRQSLSERELKQGWNVTVSLDHAIKEKKKNRPRALSGRIALIPQGGYKTCIFFR